MRNQLAAFRPSENQLFSSGFYSIGTEISLRAYFRKKHRKSALIKVNSFSDGKGRVPRIRGRESATVPGAPKLISFKSAKEVCA